MIYRPKRDEMSGEWRRLHNEELNEIATTMVSRPCNSDRGKTKIISWLEDRMKRDHWEDRDVAGKTILEEIFEK